MTPIASGGYAASDVRTVAVATTPAEYRRLWKQLIGEDIVPEVDLDSGTVVFLVAGMRNTGGYSIVAEAVTVDADGTATVVARTQGPGAAAVATQALTSPYAVLFVASRNIKDVRWAE